jgi:hypothetical protein
MNRNIIYIYDNGIARVKKIARKILLFYFCMLAISSCMKIKYPIYTTITFTRSSIGESSHEPSFYYTYITKGGSKEQTKISRSPIKYEVFGDTYKFKYDSLDPDNRYKVFFEEPVFLLHDKTDKTVGTIVKLGSRSCEFSYTPAGIHSKQYMKQQLFYKDTRKKYPNLKKGAKFEVRYDIHNVKRSIIYFEHPRDDSTLVK